MTSKFLILASCSLAVIGVALAAAHQTGGEVEAKLFSRPRAEASHLPRKGWTVGFHAFRINGYKDLPVKVYGVTSGGLQGLQVARVSSQSDKIVIGVKIKWFVGVKGNDAILAKGETPLIDLPGLDGALPKFYVRVPDATLDKILGPVMQKRQLKGDFDVQVMVSEVKYLDGSFWNLAEPTSLGVAPRRKHHAAMDTCAGQTCRLAADLFTYQCADSSGEMCENRGESCTSIICALYMQ